VQVGQAAGGSKVCTVTAEVTATTVARATTAEAIILIEAVVHFESREVELVEKAESRTPPSLHYISQSELPLVP
jgi:hypothetical protein